MKRILLVSIGLFIVWSHLSAYQNTIYDIIQRRPDRPLEIRLTPQYVANSFEQLVQESDLIVYGRVERSRVYLSENEIRLMTDYLVHPIRILLDRSSHATAGVQEPRPIVVTRLGGEGMVGDVHVIYRHEGAIDFDSAPAFILLLKLKQDGTSYELVNDANSAFPVAEETVRLPPRGYLVEDARSRRIQNGSIEGFRAEVERVVNP
jgi:hypothetical protein